MEFSHPQPEVVVALVAWEILKNQVEAILERIETAEGPHASSPRFGHLIQGLVVNLQINKPIPLTQMNQKMLRLALRDLRDVAKTGNRGERYDDKLRTLALALTERDPDRELSATPA